MKKIFAGVKVIQVQYGINVLGLLFLGVEVHRIYITSYKCPRTYITRGIHTRHAKLVFQVPSYTYLGMVVHGHIFLGIVVPGHTFLGMLTPGHTFLGMLIPGHTFLGMLIPGHTFLVLYIPRHVLLGKLSHRFRRRNATDECSL